MAGLCKGGIEPPGPLKANYLIYTIVFRPTKKKDGRPNSNCAVELVGLPGFQVKKSDNLELGRVVTMINLNIVWNFTRKWMKEKN